MHVSAKSDLVFFTARFLRPYLLRAGKHLNIHRHTKSETQKDHLTVKTTKRRNKLLSYLKNLESFLVVTSVAMRFFRNAARSTSKNELLESIRQTISLACSVLRGRAQKDVLVAAILCSCEKKGTWRLMFLK